MELQCKAANTYSLVITRRSASEILFLRDAPVLELPRVAIYPQRRIAEQLTTEVKRTWGLETYCLSFPATSQVEDTKCAVLEVIGHNDKAPAGTHWTPRASAEESAEVHERCVIQSLEQLGGDSEHAKGGYFTRPGWLRELFIWVQEKVAPSGLRLTGNFRQLNASPTFSLIRLETDGGAVWFKATGEPNTHELPVTLALAKLFPVFVPRVLGVNIAWNGWISAEVPGVPLQEIAECAMWERVAETLAELQVSSIGKSTELLRAKLKDLRAPKLAKRISPFLAQMSKLMAAQEKRTPAPLVGSELQTLAEGLEEACALLESLGIPDTVGHIDFNPGNILISRDRCIFLDWAEGCITSPFVTFEYLAEHMSRTNLKGPASRERLVTAYLRPWTSLYTSEVLRRALALSPLIAVFAYAVAGETWRSPDLIHDSILAGYFRSLTRRMYREAIHAALGSEVCLD